ncbi:MAG: PDZ domain-containing protein [Planctomycetes bacterium]|nr:PDZ domain-containing protein [Planctomycetota bacterium]
MRFAGSVFCALMLLAMGATALAAQSGTAWLGVKLEVVDAPEAKKLGIDGGLKVTRVDDKSPAAEAGLVKGDIVLSAGEDTITTIEQMRDVIAAKRPGDMLSLGVRHENGRSEPLMITLGSTADKDDKFGDDAKVKDLRERLRDLDAERRRLQEDLDRRLAELRAGKADKDTTKPTTEEPADPEVKPDSHQPERVTLKVTMGASFVNLEAAESKKLDIEGGIRVTNVTRGGAAEEAGLKVDDVVVFANSDTVTGTGELRVLLAKHEPGDRLELEVIRDGKRKNLTVVLRAKNANGR